MVFVKNVFNDSKESCVKMRTRRAAAGCRSHVALSDQWERATATATNATALRSYGEVYWIERDS